MLLKTATPSNMLLTDLENSDYCVSFAVTMFQYNVARHKLMLDTRMLHNLFLCKLNRQCRLTMVISKEA